MPDYDSNDLEGAAYLAEMEWDGYDDQPTLADIIRDGDDIYEDQEGT